MREIRCSQDIGLDRALTSSCLDVFFQSHDILSYSFGLIVIPLCFPQTLNDSTQEIIFKICFLAFTAAQTTSAPRSAAHFICCGDKNVTNPEQ